MTSIDIAPPARLTVATFVVMLAVFAVDLVMPVAFPLGALYVVPVYFTVWLKNLAVIMIVPALATVLVTAAYVLAPQEGASTYTLMNHALAVVLIWITASVAVVHRRLMGQVRALTDSLEQRVQQRTRELEASNRELQELNRLKSAFVSVASHEIRTPVTAIKGYAENLRDEILGPITPSQGQTLVRILANVERLMRTIEELLDLAKIEAGHVQLVPKPLSVGALFKETVDMMRPMADRKSLKIIIHDPQPDLWVQADKDKLQQVLTNLLQNSINFTQAGGRIELSAGQDGSAAEVSVADNGPGIPEDELPKVFDRFYRGSAAPRAGQGAGLGLTIVKGLVELHGGEITAHSRIGVGSRFVIRLPGRAIAPPVPTSASTASVP